MRITATHLRIGLLVVNLILSVGVAAYAGYGIYSSASQVETIELIDPASFLPSEADSARAAQGTGSSRIQIAATWLQPRPPAPPDKGPEPEKTDPSEATAAAGEEELGPGFLDQKGWEYTGYIVWKDNPLLNQVTLAKKDAAAGLASGLAAVQGAPGSNRSGVRRPPLKSSRITNPRKIGGTGQPTDRITFNIEKRWYKDEEQDLNFMIHSSDKERFVYWEPGKPGKMYALKFQKKSQWWSNPKDGLRPPPNPAEAEGGEAAQEKPSGFKRGLPVDFENRKEADYQAMLNGAAAGPAITTESIPAPNAGTPRPHAAVGAGAMPAATPGWTAGATPGAASKAAPAAGGGPPGAKRDMNEDERKQFKDALKQMPKEAQEELKKELLKSAETKGPE